MAWWVAAISWAVMIGHLSEDWYYGFAFFVTFALGHLASALKGSFYGLRRGDL